MSSDRKSKRRLTVGDDMNMAYTTLQGEKIPKVALGTWSWGTGINGGNQVFGNHVGIEDVRGVFEEATGLGLNLWDTATVYGMGASEKILGGLCTKFR